MFLSCAITGGMSVPRQSAAIPVTPEEIIESAARAHAAGAAIVHIHVREPDTGKPAADLALFREVLEGIGERCNAMVQPTTGGGVGMTIEKRARVVTECRPEMATFNCGSFNFGIFRRGTVRRWRRGRPSTWSQPATTSSATRSATSTGSPSSSGRPAPNRSTRSTTSATFYNLHHLAEQGLVDLPLHLQFVLGVLGANAATLAQLIHMRRTGIALFGEKRFTWSAAGVGYPGQFHLAAAALMLGGHVRVGLEDNLRVSMDRRARSNDELVEKAFALAPLLDRAPVGADEARRGLGIAGPH